MATSWTPPPAFATGEVLSAAMLNAIGDDQQLLYGLATSPTATHASLLTDNESLDTTGPIWYVRHKQRYLHWKVEWSGSPSQYRVFVDYPTNGTAIYDPAIPSSGEAYAFDLDLLGTGAWSSFSKPADDAWYTVHFEITAAGVLKVLYVGESDTTDLNLDPSSGGSWATMPTLADGYTVSAVHLNNISNNTQYLYDILSQPNAPFSCIRTENDSLHHSPANAVWYITYRQKYLHYAFTLTGTTSHCKIYVNSVLVVDISSPTSSETIPNVGVIDLSAISPGLTKGDLYPVHCHIEDSSTLHILYFFQSELASWDPLP